MATSSPLPDSPEAWALPSPCSEGQGGDSEKAEKKPSSPAEERAEEAPSPMAFDAPQLRQRRPPHSAPRLKKGETLAVPLVHVHHEQVQQQQQQQHLPQLQHQEQQQTEGLGAPGRERKDRMMVGAEGETGMLLWRPGGDNSDSPSAAIAAVPVLPTAATTATSSPVNRSSSTPSISPKAEHKDSGIKTERQRSTEQPRSCGPLKTQGPSYQQPGPEMPYKSVTWRRLWGGGAAIPQPPWLLLLKQQMLLRPLLVVAIPSLLLAAVPVSCVLCVLAAGLLPVSLGV